MCGGYRSFRLRGDQPRGFALLGDRRPSFQRFLSCLAHPREVIHAEAVKNLTFVAVPHLKRNTSRHTPSALNHFFEPPRVVRREGTSLALFSCCFLFSLLGCSKSQNLGINCLAISNQSSCVKKVSFLFFFFFLFQHELNSTHFQTTLSEESP